MSYLKKGNEALLKRDYELAIVFYEKALENPRLKGVVDFNLVFCRGKLNKIRVDLIKNAQDSSAVYEGHVDSFSDGLLNGWMVSKADSSLLFDIKIKVGGELFCSVQNDQPREDLVLVNKSTGLGGFIAQIPSVLLDEITEVTQGIEVFAPDGQLIAQVNAPQKTVVVAVENMPEWFDSSWYLQQYPDIASARIDPWLHYQRFGRDEGRLPAPNRALSMSHVLWRGGHDVMLPRLENLLLDSDTTVLEKQQSRWELARWHAWQNNWQQVVDLLTPVLKFVSYQADSILPRLLMAEALCRLKVEPSSNNDQIAAISELLLNQLQCKFSDFPEAILAKSNLLLVSEQSFQDAGRLSLFNSLLDQHNLMNLRLRDFNLPLSLTNLTANISDSERFSQASPSTIESQPLVSVIVPVYNAAQTLPAMLHSLFEQTWSQLEILLVDDASTDNSLAVVQSLQVNCPSHIQLRVIEQSSNQGAYAARNAALVVAKGEFITTHDSDDWSHPQKLEQQVTALLDSAAVACFSYWVRATEELLFHRWRLDGYGWIYPNLSSMMFNASVVKTLGFWDQVRVNADSEYRDRIKAVFGKDSVLEVLPGVPLSFGLADEGSLSQHSSTHLVTQFSGLRHDYMQAARDWHVSTSDLYMPQFPDKRPFLAPVAMLCSPPTDFDEFQSGAKPKEVTRVSGWFDTGWYFQRYIHLQCSAVDPFEHFWMNAGKHGFDPGPNFSSSGYVRACPEAEGAQNPLWHFLQNKQDESSLEKNLPVWVGEKFTESRPTLMLCGHQAGIQLYGAERSLLDVIVALDQLGFNVLVTLPEALNLVYEQAILSNCSALAVLPYGWWQKGRQPVEVTVNHFSHLIKRFNVVAVHANTLVLDEPLRAARLNGIPSVVHVRELPAADKALCETLGSDSKEIITHAAELADLLIANSQHTKDEFYHTLAATEFCDVPIEVVPNTVSMKPLFALPRLVNRSGNEKLRVGMLSSNLPKKGLADIEALSLLLKESSHIELVLVGPETGALNALLDKQSQGELPSNITYFGYVDAPEKVLGTLDVVINLSHFQESFGRTVLEAMAAARPVVAYHWGALPELVEHGVTGFLAPLGDVQAIADHLQALAEDPQLSCCLGDAGRKRGRQYFGSDAVVKALGDAYCNIALLPLGPEP